MTRAQALADRRVLYRLADVADCDPRTVQAALQGRKGKGSAYRRACEAIEAAGIEQPSPRLVAVPATPDGTQATG